MNESLYGKHAVFHCLKANRRKVQKPSFVKDGIPYLEVSSYPYVDFNELLQKKFLLILDQIQDPQNLGALCRSAHIFGVEGIILAETHASPVTPTVVHASAGAVEYLEIAKISSIAQALERLKENEFWIYGADAEAPKSLFEEKFPSKIALVIGNEEKGMRRLVKERCDILLKIPAIRSEIGSLNASVAGGIMMCEISRSLHKK